jgi:hypothetical protein
MNLFWIRLDEIAFMLRLPFRSLDALRWDTRHKVGSRQPSSIFQNSAAPAGETSAGSVGRYKPCKALGNRSCNRALRVVPQNENFAAN